MDILAFTMHSPYYIIYKNGYQTHAAQPKTSLIMLCLQMLLFLRTPKTVTVTTTSNVELLGANIVMRNVQLLQEMTRNLDQLKTELATTHAQLERANRSLEVVRAESRERAQLVAGLQKEVRRLEDRKNVLEYRCKSAVALTYFRSLSSFRMTFLRMRNKYKIFNLQRNNKDVLDKCHGLFVNSYVMIAVKSCLKYRSIQ